MHRLGIVLAVMVAIATIVAAVFTAKLVAVRNSWTAKSVALKKKYAELLPKAEELEARTDRLRNELHRSQELWGRYWPEVQTIPNLADGSVNVNIGVESGIHQGLLLHGFEIAADGSSIYRGSFLATEVGNGGSNLRPNWRVTADDVRQWKQANWRWRNTIPSGYQENIDRELLTNLKYEETLADRRLSLATQNDLFEQANATLRLREAELVGGDELPKSESVDPEFRDGLVAAAEHTEEERNKTLIEIDELRRKVRAEQAEIERLNADNANLIRKLPSSNAQPRLTQKK